MLIVVIRRQFHITFCQYSTPIILYYRHRILAEVCLSYRYRSCLQFIPKLIIRARQTSLFQFMFLYLLLITDLSVVGQRTARCVNFLLEQLVYLLVNRASLPVTDGLIIHFADGPDGIGCRGDPDLIGVIQF